ncbi:hypothetical protein [Methanospirillum lacunae]|uniref:Capsule biosynthesis protein n=1 Tax=Methanospirillum lacunae TaxID=668570 RepID=A0A2V2MWQ8_9EURY|nr:hypothetical protein [Methanospirillum lacunae]PWR70695.1 hypothetical protein DK846_13880 [Methanospirillum lacunae]
MISKVFSFYKKNIQNLKSVLFKPEDYLHLLDNIDQEINQFPIIKSNHSIKILIGPSFSIYPPCFIHDRILSYALRLRNATIIPTYCDSIQSFECNVFGGVWNTKGFTMSCHYCQKQSELLWHNNPIKPYKLSIYISSVELKEVHNKIAHLDDNWIDYKEGNFLFGKWAKDILVNNYVVGDYHLIPDYNNLGKVYLQNLLILSCAYRNLINEIKPDRVVTNDSYYGMWALLQHICEEKNIPFYSHWIGGRPDGWCYAYNNAAMNLDFSPSWKSFVNKPLNKQQVEKVKNWINSRYTGREMILDTASLQSHNSVHFDFSKFDMGKKTAILAANVIWDLAALNKQIVFSDMIDWIIQTIKWFAIHSEYQLIIKPHPGELHPEIPETKERIEIALSLNKVTIPNNVFLLPTKVDCTVYDLIPLTTVGLVHTTTVGIELAGRGIPVITTAHSPYRGFGFTIDPVFSEEYFSDLERCLNGEILIEQEKQIEKAYKFILFYQYHYYTKVDIMHYTWGKEPQLKIKSLSDLLPGKNKARDYIIDSIIKGIPILSEERWPPET